MTKTQEVLDAFRSLEKELGRRPLYREVAQYSGIKFGTVSGVLTRFTRKGVIPYAFGPGKRGPSVATSGPDFDAAIRLELERLDKEVDALEGRLRVASARRAQVRKMAALMGGEA